MSDPIKIVCFGDSNTWGLNPLHFLETKEVQRLPYGETWPGVLQSKLGSAFRIIDNGVSGRLTHVTDPEAPHQKGKNGLDHFKTCLNANRPVNAFVILLGTNNAKAPLLMTPEDIAEGVRNIALLAKDKNNGVDGKSAEIILVSPPPIVLNEFNRDLFQGGAEKIEQVRPLIQQVAEKLNVHYIDAKEELPCELPDGIHFSKGDHYAMALAAEHKLRSIFGQTSDIASLGFDICRKAVDRTEENIRTFNKFNPIKLEGWPENPFAQMGKNLSTPFPHSD